MGPLNTTQYNTTLVVMIPMNTIHLSCLQCQHNVLNVGKQVALDSKVTFNQPLPFLNIATLVDNL